ncbi:MAG: hypothetical protein IKO41_15830 [Lachnospiraceae bacterium]|nr:hypothetical protein [Lachnospiraceae bacterium]
MATEIKMFNPQTGIEKTGLYGFSWTTFFFGGFPALFRGDIMTGVLVILGCIFSCGLFALIWAFFYNKKYTLDLVEKGYEFAGTPEENERARKALGIVQQGAPRRF